MKISQQVFTTTPKVTTPSVAKPRTTQGVQSPTPVTPQTPATMKSLESKLDSLGAIDNKQASNSGVSSQKVDEKTAKEMLANGSNDMKSAQAKGQECQDKASQTQQDMQVAKSNSDSAVKNIQEIKTRLTTLTQKKLSVSREVQVLSTNVKQTEAKFKEKEKILKALNEKAKALQNRDDPQSQAELEKVSTQIKGLGVELKSLSGKLKTSHTALVSKQAQLSKSCSVEASYYQKMNGLARQYESSNSSFQKFAQNLANISSTVKEIGQTTDTTGKTMQSTGKALTATGIVSAIFTLGASSSLAAIGKELMTLGSQVSAVGQSVMKIGQMGYTAASATLQVTNIAQGNIQNFMGVAISSIASAQNISSEISAINENLSGISKTINDLENKTELLFKNDSGEV